MSGWDYIVAMPQLTWASWTWWLTVACAALSVTLVLLARNGWTLAAALARLRIGHVVSRHKRGAAECVAAERLRVVVAQLSADLVALEQKLARQEAEIRRVEVRKREGVQRILKALLKAHPVASGAQTRTGTSEEP